MPLQLRPGSYLPGVCRATKGTGRDSTSGIHGQATGAMTSVQPKGGGGAHGSVNHGFVKYFREMAHTNRMESFWPLMKRYCEAIYHKMSPKRLDRYVQELS